MLQIISHLNFKENCFIIVNSDKSNQLGTHWLLLCKKSSQILFGDPLGLPITYYPYICDRLFYTDLGVTEIIKSPLQKTDSNLCGLYCIYIAHYVFSAYFPSIPYIAHYVFSAYFPSIPYISEQELLRFTSETFHVIRVNLVANACLNHLS